MSSDSPTNSRAPRKRPAAKSITPEPIPDEDYALKRQRNNAAVNKTRQKKRQEEQHTQSRVQKLRDENTQLERKVESMKRELELLKEMVVACAAGRSQKAAGGASGS